MDATALNREIVAMDPAWKYSNRVSGSLPSSRLGDLPRREARPLDRDPRDPRGGRRGPIIAAAVIVALAAYHIRSRACVATITYGAAYGLFPIGWVVFSAILLYRLTLESGKFESSGTPSATSPTIRSSRRCWSRSRSARSSKARRGSALRWRLRRRCSTGLGFPPFYAAAICLLANTAPVAFGSIGTPIMALGVTTGLPIDRLSAGVGRICAPVSLFVPAYLILVMSGGRACGKSSARRWPAASRSPGRSSWCRTSSARN